MSIKINKTPLPPIRKITVGAFKLRITPDKYAVLLEIADSDYNLKARLSIIDGLEYVDLDDALLRDSVSSLVSQGVLTQEDSDRIFADGVIQETPQYKGYLNGNR